MMKTFQESFHTITSGRGLIDVTTRTNEIVAQSKIETGLVNIFLHHTSASIVICENADHLVQQDLNAFMLRLIPDGDPLYQHIAEGPDDMPSHVRTILTQSALMIPITQGKIALGRWQGIYLWEHRLKSHDRRITITVQGTE